MINEKFTFGQKPAEERYFSTLEVSEMIGCSDQSIAAMIKKTGIKPLKIHTGRTYKNKFTWEQYKILEAWHKGPRGRPKTQTVEVKKDDNMLNLEDLKALHPLVTDERFLKLSFWPNVIPACFEEIDSWVV